jgi:hypothetical protein
MPRNMLSRASTENFTSLADILVSLRPRSNDAAFRPRLDG